MFDIHPNYGDPYYDAPSCDDCGWDMDWIPEEDDRHVCLECLKGYQE